MHVVLNVATSLTAVVLTLKRKALIGMFQMFGRTAPCKAVWIIEGHSLGNPFLAFDEFRRVRVL